MEPFQRFGTEVIVTLKNFRTEIDGDIKDAIDAISRDRGMTIRAISERVFGWLSTQPSEVQAVILGQIPAERDFIELVLKRISDQSTSPTTGSLPEDRGASASSDAASQASSKAYRTRVAGGKLTSKEM